MGNNTKTTEGHIATCKTIKINGTQPIPVTVECLITAGVGIHLVELPDTAVKESLLRVVTALQAIGYRIPGKKTVINLAPANITKGGNGYDLPIILTILAASEQVNLPGLKDSLVLGELSLDGKVRTVPGSVQAYLYGNDDANGIKRVIIPYEDAVEIDEIFNLSECFDIPVYGVKNLHQAIEAVSDRLSPIWEMEHESAAHKTHTDGQAWRTLASNPGARRAAEIAAAGGHNILFIGAPGSAKTTTAKAVNELLPPPSLDEVKETAAVYSAGGRLGCYPVFGRRRPFRAPHCSASMAAIFGGGASDSINPGEVSLANNGVLYLDEYAEWPKSMLEALRGPIEDGNVHISRLKTFVEYPTRFLLVASTNPCPCGYYGEGDRCTCTKGQRHAYLARLSGPVFDRIDIQVWMHPAKTGISAKDNDPIDEARKRVLKARDVQEKRFRDKRTLNADMRAKDIEKYCRLDEELTSLMETLITRLGLSARAYTRILKIARTIADLDGRETLVPADISEAASYRYLDRTNID